MRTIIAKAPQGVPEGEREQASAAAIEFDARGGAGQRLDRYLAARLPDVSRSRLQHWIALGAVRCDERILPAKTRLRGIETIIVEPQPRDADAAFAADPVALCIVDEDDDILVLCKPAGLVVHPAPGNWRGTLMNGLLYHRPALAGLPRAGIVHRLDRDTSGLLVVAKSERAFGALTQQLAQRRMGRRYLALADGLSPQRGTIDAAIGRDEVSRVRMAVMPAARGRPARTFFRQLAVGSIDGRSVSLLECRLESGRTHQIRVHLRSIGHPLVGDTLYGGAIRAGFARQALHAWRLELAHPHDGRAMIWRAAVPEDLASLCRSAGIDLRAALQDAERAFPPGGEA